MPYQYELYGGMPPHQKGSDTSRAAAFSAQVDLGKKQRAVYRFIRRSEDGYTDDELEVLTGWSHQTVSARRRELVLKGLVKGSGNRRQTRHGRYATVWVAGRGPEAGTKIADGPTDKDKLKEIYAALGVSNHKDALREISTLYARA